MAGSKDIRKKIKSVRSTRKITRTMEMVATSKMKRALDRVLKAQPYLQGLHEMLLDLLGGLPAFRHPLLEKRGAVKNSLILLVTANRGLCGGYNSNLIRMTKRLYEEKKAAGLNPQLYICGRKGVQFFKFIGVPAFKTVTTMTDRPSFADAEAIASELITLYTSGAFDDIQIVYSHYESAGRQPATTMALLPFPVTAGERAARSEFIIEPDPASILTRLLPLTVKNEVYRVLIEAAACEQFARRVAMKNATDSAEEIERHLVLNYNKARQAQITKELLEIVGGAEALK